MQTRQGLLGALIVAVAATACSSIALDQSPVGKPRWTVGDRWTTRTTDLWKYEEIESFEQSVASVDGDRIALERRSLTHVSGRPGKQGIEWYDGATWTPVDAGIVEGKVVVLAFPLFVGKTWQYQYKTADSSGNTTLHSRTASVDGWENVAVPAGTFKAIKIVVDGRWRAHIRDAVFTGKATETLWYAPEAKRWIKREVISRTPEGGVSDQFRDELIRVELEK